MSPHQQRPQGRRHQGSPAGGSGPKLDLSAVKLKPGEDGALPASLFDSTAKDVAKAIGENKNGNKATQIRKFYEELASWEERARQDPKRFHEFLPFIRMLNAKAAYANGRQNVDDNFVRWIGHCLDQVDSIETLTNFKLFYEAFLGFYKVHGPKG